MLRYFLVLAVTNGSLLVTSFVLGLLATGEPRGPVRLSGPRILSG